MKTLSRDLKKILAVSIVLPFLALGFGCASSKHFHTFTLSSSPPGARIMINGEFRAFTPTMTSLITRKDYEVIFILEGYETYKLSIKPYFDSAGWVIGNIFVGGLIGLAIDAASGKYHRLSSDDISAQGQVINVKLKPIKKKEE